MDLNKQLENQINTQNIGRPTKYFLINNDFVIAFDVDQTLVIWSEDYKVPGPDKVELETDSGIVWLDIHSFHVQLLKNYKKRGFAIIVWSAAGFNWANQVVQKLGLSEHVDLVLSKTVKFFDDLPADKVLGEHLYFHPVLKNEEWRPVLDYEKEYEVSNLGRVRRINKDGTRIVKALHPSTTGYLTVAISKNRKSKNMLVHRLVAQVFCPNPYKKAAVHHKDSNRQNNKASNLEWVTIAENNKYAHKMPRKGRKYSQGTSNQQAKLSEKDVFAILSSKKSTRELAEKYNVTKTAIQYIKRGKSWRHCYLQFKNNVDSILKNELTSKT